MSPKVFLTGATGYIGGDILYTISRAHPDWQIACLVRGQEKGDKVAKAYPDVRLVYGDIDKTDILEEEASQADVVIHTAASDDHQPSAEAIVRGITRRQSASPGYYIHTSGAFALAVETITTGRYGERFDKVYDDWDNIHELTHLPDSAPHRHVDKVVLAADPNRVKTAIVAPTVVYGQGRGPDKATLFDFFGTFLKYGKVLGVGKGENIWHNIHVQDLSQLYLLLAEAAVAGGGNATWNERGYYLAENGFYVLREMLQTTAKIANDKGLLESTDVEFVTAEESNKVSAWLKIMVGADSQGRSIRARNLLGWTPKMPRFEDEIGGNLDRDAKVMGLS